MNAQPVAAQVIRQPGRMTGQCERGRLAKPTSKVSASLWASSCGDDQCGRNLGGARYTRCGFRFKRRRPRSAFNDTVVV